MTRRTRLAAVAMMLSLLGAMPAVAQDPLQPRIQLKGFQAFLNLLWDEEFKPLPHTDALADVKPSETLIVVFGDPRGLDRVRATVGGLAQFRAGDGAILIATDQREPRRLSELGVAVDGRAVSVTPKGLAEGRAYRNVAVCPFIHPNPLIPHPIFEGLRLPVAANEPTLIRLGAQATLLGLGFLPQDSHLADRDEDVSASAFVVGTLDGQRGGPALVIAGHGLFMNHMLGRQDNDNLRFAGNCVRWLCGGGQRKYAIFIENDSVASKFDVPLARLPELPPQVVNAALSRLEGADFFNRLILENTDRERVLGALTVALSLGVGLFALFRLLKAQHGYEPGPPAAPKVEGAASELPLAVQRQRHQLDRKDYREAARALAQLYFEEGESKDRPSAPPRVARGGPGLQRQVDRLWELAYGGADGPVSPEEFAEVAAAVAQVRAALGSVE